jgi:hypothetical protein
VRFLFAEYLHRFYRVYVDADVVSVVKLEDYMFVVSGLRARKDYSPEITSRGDDIDVTPDRSGVVLKALERLSVVTLV